MILQGYHSGRRVMRQATESHPWRIGFEIEKEDSAVRYRDYHIPRGWIVERDGSLGFGGFELITPAFNLTRSRRSLVKAIDDLRPVLDADTSSRCGGHITLSHYRYSDRQTLAHMAALWPLMFALWPRRLQSPFVSGALSKRECLQAPRDCRRNVALRLRGWGVECRVPSAVRFASSLLWRFDLVAMFARDRYDYARVMRELKPGGRLSAHLAKIYAPDVIAVKRDLYAAFARLITAGELMESLDRFSLPNRYKPRFF